jgi:hypothetical protein
LESVLVDGALGAPLGVGRLYGFQAQIAPDGVSRDAQKPGDLAQSGLVLAYARQKTKKPLKIKGFFINTWRRRWDPDWKAVQRENARLFAKSR